MFVPKPDHVKYKIIVNLSVHSFSDILLSVKRERERESERDSAH